MPHLAVVPELEQELDRLYGLQLDEFTAARNELAARLKKAGQAEAAEMVRALKKPSIAVWTVNQLARRAPDEIATLLDAGARLRDAADVRRATRDERDAVRAMTRRAEQLLTQEGRSASQQTLERINATLRAAAVEPDAADLLRGGRLPDEVESGGFAVLATMAPTTPPKRGRARKEEKVDLAARREHELALRRLRREAEQAERAAAEAEAEAERTAKEAVEARERAKQARRTARDAAKALAAEERRGE
jgi:hypothetical protein